MTLEASIHNTCDSTSLPNNNPRTAIHQVLPLQKSPPNTSLRQTAKDSLSWQPDICAQALNKIFPPAMPSSTRRQARLSHKNTKKTDWSYKSNPYTKSALHSFSSWKNKLNYMASCRKNKLNRYYWMRLTQQSLPTAHSGTADILKTVKRYPILKCLMPKTAQRAAHRPTHMACYLL